MTVQQRKPKLDYSEPITLLIDGDILAFQVSATSQKTIEWDDAEDNEEPSVHLNDDQEVLEAMAAKIDSYVERLKATDFYVCLSCSSSDNWRKGVLSTYKSNRDDTVKPQLLQKARELLKAHYKVLAYPKLEADDIMGIYSTNPELLEGERIIVSIDKDMKTIPGWLYNPNDDTLAYITELEADRYHMSQVITGDTVDGYQGLPGAGKVYADKLLKGCESLSEMWSKVLEAYYEKAYKDALAMARVSNIFRCNQFNVKNKRRKLWEPPVT